MPAWFETVWGTVAGWVLFVFALAKAIQATYAAERDRKALESVVEQRAKLALAIEQLRASLASSDLQREKLSLEIQLLTNSPEVVANRRAIYERLRTLLNAILETAAPTIDQVRAMYAILHDAQFAFQLKSEYRRYDSPVRPVTTRRCPRAGRLGPAGDAQSSVIIAGGRSIFRVEKA